MLQGGSAWVNTELIIFLIIIFLKITKNSINKIELNYLVPSTDTYTTYSAFSFGSVVVSRTNSLPDSSSLSILHKKSRAHVSEEKL